MKKKYLLLPIEIISRELDSRILIALRLLKLDCKWQIIIGKTNKIGDFWRSKVESDSKFIYLSKGMTFSKLYFINMIKKGGFYFLLDEEGAIFSPYINKYWTRGANNNDLLKHVSKIFFWGNNELLNYKKRHSGYLTESKIEVTGNPRFDLCKKKYESFYSSISKKLTNQNKFIMVDTAFGTYNNIIDINLQFEHWKNVKYEKNRGEVDRTKWLEKIKPLYEYQKKIFPIFLDGILNLCTKLPDQNFLIRPHPVENVNTYKNYFKNQKNVIVSNEGTAVEKFKYAQLIIHNGCSTAVEAFFAKTPMICFLPSFNEEMVQSLPKDISLQAFDKNDLESMVKEALTDEPKSLFNTNLSIVKNYIDNVDYESSDKIANIINKFDLNNKINLDYDLSIRSLLHIVLPNKIIDIIKSLIKKFKSNFKNKSSDKSFEIRDKIKFPSLLSEDLDKRFAAFLKIDKNLPKANAYQIDNDLFKININ